MIQFNLLSLIFAPAVIGDLMQQLDVFISVKPKKGQMQSVIIKSIEQNLHCVYQARNKLLECSYQPTQAATPSDTIAIATSLDEPPMFQEKKGKQLKENVATDFLFYSARYPCYQINLFFTRSHLCITTLAE